MAWQTGKPGDVVRVEQSGTLRARARKGSGVSRETRMRFSFPGLSPTSLQILTSQIGPLDVGTSYEEAIAVAGGNPPYYITPIAGRMPGSVSGSARGAFMPDPESGAHGFDLMLRTSPLQPGTEVVTVEVTDRAQPRDGHAELPRVEMTPKTRADRPAASITIGGTYATIQEAIDARAAGTLTGDLTIFVPATHVERNIDFKAVPGDPLTWIQMVGFDAFLTSKFGVTGPELDWFRIEPGTVAGGGTARDVQDAMPMIYARSDAAADFQDGRNHSAPARNYVLRGIALEAEDGNGLGGTNGIFNLVLGGLNWNDLVDGERPGDIWIYQCILSGGWYGNDPYTDLGFCRGLLRGSWNGLLLQDSYAYGAWDPNGADPQAVLIENGRNCMALNSFLEGGAENFMVHGGDGIVTFEAISRDITLRHCHLYKRPEWCNVSEIPGRVPDGAEPWGSVGYDKRAAIKTHIETKAAYRWLTEWCVFENSAYGAQNQKGSGIVWKVQTSNPADAARVGTAADLVARYIVMQNVNEIGNITTNPSVDAPGMSRWTLHDVIAMRVDPASRFFGRPGTNPSEHHLGVVSLSGTITAGLVKNSLWQYYNILTSQWNPDTQQYETDTQQTACIWIDQTGAQTKYGQPTRPCFRVDIFNIVRGQDDSGLFGGGVIDDLVLANDGWSNQVFPGGGPHAPGQPLGPRIGGIVVAGYTRGWGGTTAAVVPDPATGTPNDSTPAAGNFFNPANEAAIQYVDPDDNNFRLQPTSPLKGEGWVYNYATDLWTMPGNVDPVPDQDMMETEINPRTGQPYLGSLSKTATAPHGSARWAPNCRSNWLPSQVE